MEVNVLRLNHRPSRDKRVSTHLLLAARAFGALGAVYTGTPDPSLERSIHDLVENWGGWFQIRYGESWRSEINDWKSRGKIVHLTMYGLPIQDLMSSIREDSSDKLIVVGGAKVPGEVYGLVDWNVAVTSQPHSEVSALAVFLHELFEGRELLITHDGAALRITHTERGKKSRARETIPS